MHAVVARSTCRSQNAQSTPRTFGPLLDVEASFCVAGAKEKCAKRECFVVVSETLAGAGLVKRICKDAFRLASAVKETHESEMLEGPGADFLRGIAFSSIRS